MIPRWVVRSTFGLALVALAVSVYLTVVHFTTTIALVCSATDVINCERVTTSAQSRFLGIPVAVLGLAWSAGMVVLCSPGAWVSGRPWIRTARLALAGIGMAFVLWLLYAELLLIHAICLWCTVVHVATFALFVLVFVYGWAQEAEAPTAADRSGVGDGTGTSTHPGRTDVGSDA